MADSAPSSTPAPRLPAAFNALLCMVGGFVTGLATAVPLWFALRFGWRFGWGTPAPDWVYLGVCAVIVIAAIAVAAVRLRGAALALALVFAGGVVFGCAVPPLVAYVTAAI